MPRFSGMRLALRYAPPADSTPPRFLSSASGSVNENTTLSFSLTSDERTTKTISGGADAAQFEIVSGGSTSFSHVLRWAGNGAQDYENPADDDTDNVYAVDVEATDESGNTATQTISITVLDVSVESAGSPIGLLLTLTGAS